MSTSSKWQIDLIFVVEGSPARCVNERSKGGDYAPGDSKGHTLDAPLVTFPASGKSPGVEGRSALLLGVEAKSDDLLLRGQHLWCAPLAKNPGPAAR